MQDPLLARLRADYEETGRVIRFLEQRYGAIAATAGAATELTTEMTERAAGRRKGGSRKMNGNGSAAVMAPTKTDAIIETVRAAGGPVTSSELTQALKAAGIIDNAMGQGAVYARMAAAGNGIRKTAKGYVLA